VEALLDHSTSYYLGMSLIWGTVIVVVFGILAAVRFPGREATWACHNRVVFAQDRPGAVD
jgi:hypothetical protein